MLHAFVTRYTFFLKYLALAHVFLFGRTDISPEETIHEDRSTVGLKVHEGGWPTEWKGRRCLVQELARRWKKVVKGGRDGGRGKEGICLLTIKRSLRSPRKQAAPSSSQQLRI